MQKKSPYSDPLQASIESPDSVIEKEGSINRDMLAREAALQGTPSIVVSEFKRMPGNDCLAEKGFPIFIVDSSEAIGCARKHIGRKYDVKAKLAELENPVDDIQKIVEEKELTQSFDEPTDQTKN